MAANSRKKPDRKWRAPSTITSPNVELEITKAVKSLDLQAWWTMPAAISFARRSLEVALRDALKYQERRSRDQFDYWQNAKNLSSQANTALKLLIRHIEPDGLKSGIDVPSFDDVRVSHTLRMLPNGKVANRETNKAELAFLIGAQNAVKAVHDTASKYASQLTNSVGNEREHDKSAFVYRLAEAWIYLTGKPPGKGRDRNPFLRFVDVAARDADIEETDFYSAMKHAIGILEGHEQSMPGATNSRQSISGIRINGPRWLPKKVVGTEPRV